MSYVLGLKGFFGLSIVAACLPQFCCSFAAVLPQICCNFVTVLPQLCGIFVAFVLSIGLIFVAAVFECCRICVYISYMLSIVATNLPHESPHCFRCVRIFVHSCLCCVAMWTLSLFFKSVQSACLRHGHHSVFMIPRSVSIWLACPSSS